MLVRDRKRFDSTVTKAVVTVGQGRGFIIQHRVRFPPLKTKASSVGIKPQRVRNFIDYRLVVTAAHCLPYFPPCSSMSHYYERTYKRLLGPLGGLKPQVWAECLFADPIGDIAVLGSPDNQAMENEADAYEELTEEVPALRVATAPQSGRAWLLSLDGQWVPCAVTLGRNKGLSIDATPKIEPGMSGSPILADDGTAIGVLSIGAESISGGGVRKPEQTGLQPVLAHDLPAWLLRSAR
jgi:hypothetical protein